MEEGYTKDWPILRKMLIDNNLEHAAQLAYGLHVQEHLFVMRARAAFRRVVSGVEEHNARRAEVLADIAREVEESAAGVMSEAEMDAVKERARAKTEEVAAEAPKEPPSVTVTLDRVTDEPEPKKE